MTQVDFYVLERSAQADKDHYACRIANLAYGRGLKVYMQTDDAAHAATLDKTLWTFAQESFVPHAICQDTGDGSTPDPERYPVQIGHNAAPDTCLDLLISLKKQTPADYTKFGRVVELIIDDAADKKSGRERFRFYREQGVEPKTHKVT